MKHNEKELKNIIDKIDVSDDILAINIIKQYAEQMVQQERKRRNRETLKESGILAGMKVFTSKMLPKDTIWIGTDENNAQFINLINK